MKLIGFCGKQGRHYDQPTELASAFVSFPVGCPPCGNVSGPTSCGNHSTGTVNAFLELIDPCTQEQQEVKNGSLVTAWPMQGTQ